jgi:hypothetical protein
MEPKASRFACAWMVALNYKLRTSGTVALTTQALILVKELPRNTALHALTAL